MNLANVVWVEPICKNFWCFVETIGTDIAGVVVAVGKDYLMYFSEADVTDLRKPQPGFASLWIRISQLCTLRGNEKHGRHDSAETLTAR